MCRHSMNATEPTAIAALGDSDSWSEQLPASLLYLCCYELQYSTTL